MVRNPARALWGAWARAASEAARPREWSLARARGDDGRGGACALARRARVRERDGVRNSGTGAAVQPPCRGRRAGRAQCRAAASLPPSRWQGRRTAAAAVPVCCRGCAARPLCLSHCPGTPPPAVRRRAQREVRFSLNKGRYSASAIGRGGREGSSLLHAVSGYQAACWLHDSSVLSWFHLCKVLTASRFCRLCLSRGNCFLKT